MAALFHLAFPVTDLAIAEVFYVQGLGCTLGRKGAEAMILGLQGHQLVAHLTDEPLAPQKGIYPRHFGLVFEDEQAWEQMLARAQAHNLPFYQAPKRRFPDQLAEHRTFFLQDPFHNLLEFKVYVHPEAILGQLAGASVGDRV